MKLDQTPCWCIIGFHFECENKPAEDECCCSGSPKPLGITGPQKATEDIRDPKSTGRKRAVLVKPITGQDCEWKGLKFAGGGVFPIVGCVSGKAQGVHHGVNKSTLDNRPENLHAICDVCHNRFHTKNDPTYPPDPGGDTWLPDGECVPHDSVTKATTEDQIKNEIYWNTRPKNRGSLEALFDMQENETATGVS